MKELKEIGLDFEIDKLTNSIENVITGDSFASDISLLTNNDLKSVTKTKGWLFNWKEELSLPDREVYKLTIVNNANIVQGITSLTVKSDNVFLHLIETAPFNKGKEKLYEGVPGNLIAFACRLSFQRGSDGFVSFHSKTNLIDHYVKSLNAVHYGNHLMVIRTDAALNLVNKYFKS